MERHIGKQVLAVLKIRGNTAYSCCTVVALPPSVPLQVAYGSVCTATSTSRQGLALWSTLCQTCPANAAQRHQLVCHHVGLASSAELFSLPRSINWLAAEHSHELRLYRAPICIHPLPVVTNRTLIPFLHSTSVVGQESTKTGTQFQSARDSSCRIRSGGSPTATSSWNHAAATITTFSAAKLTS
jgi:hypothetical protein